MKMTQILIDVGQLLAGLTMGAVIGVGFSKVQDSARTHYEQLERGDGLKSEWLVLRGSGQRVALLLIALVIVQVVCPLLFRNGTQWWVSGGVVAGYGWRWFCQFRQRRLKGL